jgi:phage/plasmid-like protein (TIGR03299 family)
MSQESSKWLNTHTLIGFTEKRGHAWHYRETEQGEESNHYPGAIPVDDVQRRLFDFTVEERELFTTIETDGILSYVGIPDRKALVTSDTGDVLGVFKSGYQGHQYSEWLLSNVATILDDTLQIGSAGLLRNRAQAWVSVEVEENSSAVGMEYRPHLLACTSFDGSLATTYKRTVTAVVCDNTLSAALGERDQAFRLRHTKYSGMRLQDAREALQLVYSLADDFAEELERLAAWKVSESQWTKALDILVPVPQDEGRGRTVAITKQDQMMALYRHDERAAQWKGTALGVLQAFNTWSHHYAQVRKGIPRAVRNMENAVNGSQAAADTEVLRVLADVCA